MVYVYNFKPPKNESFWFENSWNGSENRLVPILVIQRLAPTWWLSRVLSMTTKQKFDKWMPKHVIMMARKWGPIKYIQTYWHVMTRACSFLFSSMTGNSGGSSKTRRMNVWGAAFQQAPSPRPTLALLPLVLQWLPPRRSAKQPVPPCRAKYLQGQVDYQRPSDRH